MTNHLKSSMPEEIFVKEFVSGDETIMEALYVEANAYQRYTRANTPVDDKRTADVEVLKGVRDALLSATQLFPRGKIFENAFNVHVECDKQIAALNLLIGRE